MSVSRANLARFFVAALLFGAYCVLGSAVSHAPPGTFDRAAAALFFGHSTAVAILLTKLGLLPSYLTVCVALVLLALVRRNLVRDVAIAIVALLGAEAANQALKVYFLRPRSDNWLYVHEKTYSYSSGHATLSLVFYGFWACVAATSSLEPRAKVAAVALLSSVFLAIGWSRMALGAHYATDVLGGYLLGVVVLLVAFLVRSLVRAGPSERVKYLRAPRVQPRVRVGQDFR